MLKSGSNWRFFGPCDCKITQLTLKNNGTFSMPLQAQFHSHPWILTGVIIWKLWNRGQNDNFLALATLKFDRWPWKTIGNLLNATSSCVHYFVVINEFKLELRSKNPQLGSKLVIFVPRDLEIWRITSKNNRASLLKFNATSRFVHHFGTICEMELEFDLWSWPFA